MPASIRKALDLASGDAFEVHLEDGRVVLEPVEVIATERYTNERIKEFLTASEMGVEELAESRRKWELS
ncbi:MAG: AbrB/MazE/SpoVT family DNA-binding domain-containing protein [Trueperaceae bacterium]|nr:MAG: AbrB/MazE/SpoVT family DNA-binding domain-containing protein [Trueperaceae bacterium]